MSTGPDRMSDRRIPHVVLIVPRGEAVRNFLYSDTLKVLKASARVTVLSVIDDPAFLDRFEDDVDRIVPIEKQRERWLVQQFRFLLHEAHIKWLDSHAARNIWEIRDVLAASLGRKIKRILRKAVVNPLAHRPVLETLTDVERYLTWAFRPNDFYVELLRELQPDLVFNCSHIHGPAAELPVKIAHRMGIPTAGFIFSWDNLTSRGRIFVPYDYFLVWHEQMRDELLELYPAIDPERVLITGTPQFDFHFKPEFWLSREELAQVIGFDPSRPYIIYTTGVDKHFPEEHRTVEHVIRLLQDMDATTKPQLVVRTYVKGTSDEMKELAARGVPDVIFPEVQWEDRWFTPMYEDLSVYTSLLRHAALGINAASTVSLELLMLDKPVINLGFDPPGSDLSHPYRWIRHINFDHYRPVAESGAVMVARSPEEMEDFLREGLERPDARSRARRHFVEDLFGDTLDGDSGQRVAEGLVELAVGPVRS